MVVVKWIVMYVGIWHIVRFLIYTLIVVFNNNSVNPRDYDWVESVTTSGSVLVLLFYLVGGRNRVVKDEKKISAISVLSILFAMYIKKKDGRYK